MRYECFIISFYVGIPLSMAGSSSKMNSDEENASSVEISDIDI